MKTLGSHILWQRAIDYLKKYQPIVVGVTGSTGKTIAKDAIARALQTSYRVRSAPFSYNTRIGVALSILGISKNVIKNHWFKLLTSSKLKELSVVEPDLIVLELGADKPGDIDFMASRVPLNVGVVTNVQSTHLRLFTSKDFVAHEMQSLVVKVPDQGIVVLNADDPLVLSMKNKTKAKVITFGRSDTADVRLMRQKRLSSFGFACEVSISGKTHELHLPNIIAGYQLSHILSALAVTYGLKTDIPKAIKRLQSIKPPAGRMRLLRGINNARLLDDSYNASPESVLAALDLLAELPSKRKIAILGDMLNLGASTISWHRQIGERGADVADILVTIGDNMRHAGPPALNRGDVDLHHFDNSRDVGKWLRDYLHQDDMVLIKGSRAMRMEEVTRSLLANEEDKEKLVAPAK